MRLHILLTVTQSKQLGSRDDKTMQLQLYLRVKKKIQYKILSDAQETKS